MEGAPVELRAAIGVKHDEQLREHGEEELRVAKGLLGHVADDHAGGEVGHGDADVCGGGWCIEGEEAVSDQSLWTEPKLTQG